MTQADSIAFDVRPKQGDFVVARIGLFLHGRAVFGWLFGGAVSIATWICARALSCNITLFLWPILAALTATPLVYVFTGIGGARVRTLVEKGERWELDEETLTFGGARHAWSEVAVALELARVFAIVIGKELHVAPWASVATKENVRALRRLLHAHVARAGKRASS